jgi:hypothetical protein
MFGAAAEADDDATRAAAECAQLAAVRAEPWTHKELLANEKAAVGFFVSGHPLDDFADKLAQLDCLPVSELSSIEPGRRVRVAGVVSDFTVRNTKKGDRYAFFRLEDVSGVGIKCVLWPEAFKQKGKDAANDALLVCAGRCEGDGSLTLVCDEVALLENAKVPAHSAFANRGGRIKADALVIELDGDADVRRIGEAVNQALISHPGDCEVFIDLHLREHGLKVRTKTAQFIRVYPNQRLQDDLLAAGVQVRLEGRRQKAEGSQDRGRALAPDCLLPSAFCLLFLQSRHVPLADCFRDEGGDLVGHLLEILVGLLLIEAGVALPRLVEADGRGEGRGRPRAGRGVGRGEVCVVAFGVDECGINRLHEGRLVPAGVAAVLAEDLLGDVRRERPPVDDERPHFSLGGDFGGDRVEHGRLRAAVAV